MSLAKSISTSCMAQFCLDYVTLALCLFRQLRHHSSIRQSVFLKRALVLFFPLFLLTFLARFQSLALQSFQAQLRLAPKKWAHVAMVGDLSRGPKILALGDLITNLRAGLKKWTPTDLPVVPRALNFANHPHALQVSCHQLSSSFCQSWSKTWAFEHRHHQSHNSGQLLWDYKQNLKACDLLKTRTHSRNDLWVQEKLCQVFGLIHVLARWSLAFCRALHNPWIAGIDRSSVCACPQYRCI